MAVYQVTNFVFRINTIMVKSSLLSWNCLKAESLYTYRVISAVINIV